MQSNRSTYGKNNEGNKGEINTNWLNTTVSAAWETKYVSLNNNVQGRRQPFNSEAENE